MPFPVFLGRGLLWAQLFLKAQGLESLGLRGTLGHPSPVSSKPSPASPLTWLLLGSLLDLDALQLRQAGRLCGERCSSNGGYPMVLVRLTEWPPRLGNLGRRL